MNVLIKKEIRLLLPSLIVAVMLAMVQGITRPYDFYVASLLFFGLTIMALTTIGRESSLNTFSSLLAQPVERMRIWQIKLSVLAVAFLTVFAVWLAAFGIAFINSNVDASDRENSYNLFITVCLIATATFTGGLWTTLLLRQLAGAFWLTLLVPATLSGFSGIFLADSESSSIVIAVLSVVIGIYSIAGFLFARWLFFRAQDAGWSGGIIALPEWKFLAERDKTAEAVRTRKPIFALLKKEVQLQQGVLTGAAGLLVLHVGILVLRAVHQFRRDSAGEILTSIFWMLWLVLPVIIGSFAVAEERKLGVMESQLCLPASRRVQFAIKTLLTLFMGVFLGGVMPMLLEYAGFAIGARNPALSAEHPPSNINLLPFLLGSMAISAWFTLVSFFASSLARNFLQAIGFAVATFVGIGMCVPLFTERRMFFFDTLPAHSILPLLIAGPTLVVTLLVLAYWNYKNFRDGWPLWRRNLLGMLGALVLITAASSALYNRAWEYFQPIEPAHGPARLSLANPPVFENIAADNLLVRLPDGRVWFDHLQPPWAWQRSRGDVFRWFANPLPKNAGPQRFLSGSNWVSAAVSHFEFVMDSSRNGGTNIYVAGYSDSVAIQSDGSLWVSDKSDPKTWTADKLTRFGDETNWQKVAAGGNVGPVLLLKKDGTLWRWGTNFNWQGWPEKWPGLRALQPQQIGTNSDWSEITSRNSYHARKTDGSVWNVWPYGGKVQMNRETNFDAFPFPKWFPAFASTGGAFVRDDGTLWVYQGINGHGREEFETRQYGSDTNWVSVAAGWDWMMALKADGTLWEWNHYRFPVNPRHPLPAVPNRLGIHKDWVAVAGSYEGAVALAADGSLWFWPNRDSYEFKDTLMKLPKQPQFLGNIFSQSD
jgi:hypothetical protein